MEMFEEMFQANIKFVTESLEKAGRKNDIPEYLQTIYLQRDISNESDRSVALIGAAYLETLLEKLIAAKLVDDAKRTKGVFEFNGALGTFSAKIDFAYLLGLICKIELDNLHLIRKIRNKFAHEFERITFEEEDLKSMVGKLHMVQKLWVDKPANRFRRTLAYLFTTIQNKRFLISRIEAASDSEFEKLILIVAERSDKAISSKTEKPPI